MGSSTPAASIECFSRKNNKYRRWSRRRPLMTFRSLVTQRVTNDKIRQEFLDGLNANMYLGLPYKRHAGVKIVTKFPKQLYFLKINLDGNLLKKTKKQKKKQKQKKEKTKQNKTKKKYFFIHFSFFNQNFQNDRSLGDKFVFFYYRKSKNHLWVWSELKRGS